MWLFIFQSNQILLYYVLNTSVYNKSSNSHKNSSHQSYLARHGPLLDKSSIHAPNVHSMTFRDDHGHPGASYLAIIISILRYPNRSLLRQLDVGEVQGVTNDDLTAILWACRGLTSLRFRAVGKGDQRRSGIFQFIQAKCPAMRKVQLVTSMQATAIPLSWRQLCSSPYLECELEHIWV